MKAKEVLKILQNDGWFIVKQRGSHRQLKHDEKKGLVTLAFHKLSDEMAAGTMNSILKQAQIEKS
jgi:predicted RNA binding protein YcfA (HicA-like mRNA interferase family)